MRQEDFLNMDGQSLRAFSCQSNTPSLLFFCMNESSENLSSNACWLQPQAGVDSARLEGRTTVRILQ